MPENNSNYLCPTRAQQRAAKRARRNDPKAKAKRLAAIQYRAAMNADRLADLRQLHPTDPALKMVNP